MDMKKMIQRMTDLENAGKKQLNESTKLNECPPMEGPMAAPTNPGNPVTMSITLNASGNEHVADLINLMKNAGLQDAKPAADAIMPMRMDMERLRGIVDKPEMEADAAYGDVIADDEDLEEYDNEPNPEYQDHKYMTKDLSGGLNREKGAYAAAQDGDNAMAVEGSAISPKFIKHLQVTFGDKTILSRSETRKIEDMIDKMSIENLKTLVSADIPNVSDIAKDYLRNNTPGGMKSYSEDDDDATYTIKGKTPQAQSELARLANTADDEGMVETIKSRLMKALSEKKSKPDFLDMDKDGDKKEPMKKAIKDKKKKGPVKEADLDEISSDLAKRYTKNAKVDRDNTDHILKRDGSTSDWKTNQELQKRNSKRTKGINQAKKRMD